jgi:hypothetical protein
VPIVRAVAGRVGIGAAQPNGVDSAGQRRRQPRVRLVFHQRLDQPGPRGRVQGGQMQAADGQQQVHRVAGERRRLVEGGEVDQAEGRGVAGQAGHDDVVDVQVAVGEPASVCVVGPARRAPAGST